MGGGVFSEKTDSSSLNNHWVLVTLKVVLIKTKLQSIPALLLILPGVPGSFWVKAQSLPWLTQDHDPLLPNFSILFLVVIPGSSRPSFICHWFPGLLSNLVLPYTCHDLLLTLKFLSSLCLHLTFLLEANPSCLPPSHICSLCFSLPFPSQCWVPI